jgi:hypothetical protein
MSYNLGWREYKTKFPPKKITKQSIENVSPQDENSEL